MFSGRGFDSFKGVYVADVFERDEKEESKTFYKYKIKKETGVYAKEVSIFLSGGKHEAKKDKYRNEGEGKRKV